MTGLVANICAFGVVVALVWLSARNALTVMFAEVRNGKLAVKRGGIAPRPLADLRDVVMRPPVRQGTLRITRSGGRAVVEAQGDFSEAQVQQMRNVIGSMPLAQLANARVRRG
jgi:hypothetical protein